MHLIGIIAVSICLNGDETVRLMRGQHYFWVMIAFFILFMGAMKITYATNQQPNVIITIDGKERTITGSLYGNDLWYPGKEVSGIIRIDSKNNCKVTGIGLSIENQDNNTVNSFLNNMILTIEKGNLVGFDKVLVDKKSFASLCNGGVFLDAKNQFTVLKNNPVDLKYTLVMDKRAGNELENLSIPVRFLLNIEGENETGV